MHTVQVERGANRGIRLSAVALSLVVVAGGLCLSMPFWGDQALFTVYARALLRGAVLYRDIFDVKQPGIFLFYAAGGSIFGFTEIGIHLFELIYWLVFSLFMLIALRPYFSHRWAASLLPLATVVVYYLHAGTLDLTQLEMLVAFPILVGWWLIDRAQPETHTGRRRYAAAGLAAAAVVLLKHLYILIVLALLGYVVLRSWRRDVAVADIRRCLVAFVIALAVPLAIVVAYFAFHGQLQRIWWIYFEFAPATQVLAPRPFEHLVFGARRFLIGHAPILVLAVLGCVHVLRWRVQPQMDLALGMVLWGVSGAIAFFVLQGWPDTNGRCSRSHSASSLSWVSRCLYAHHLGPTASVGLRRLDDAGDSELHGWCTCASGPDSPVGVGRHWRLFRHGGCAVRAAAERPYVSTARRLGGSRRHGRVGGNWPCQQTSLALEVRFCLDHQLAHSLSAVVELRLHSCR